jgi:hypothetical protein
MPVISNPGDKRSWSIFDTGGLSKGAAEAISLSIKKLNRVGHGFPH